VNAGSSHRATRPAVTALSSAASELAGQVRDSAANQFDGTLTATVDEQYTVTAVMLEHHTVDGPRTLCIELLDHGPTSGDGRWMALAYDELRQRHTPPSSAATLGAALANLAWTQLDED
jgi:hypothetical protein